jgi:hypothetical protein
VINHVKRIPEINNYEKKLERVKGIEPSYSAWEAAALPLSYTRLISEDVQQLPPRVKAGS